MTHTAHHFLLLGTPSSCSHYWVNRKISHSLIVADMQICLHPEFLFHRLEDCLCMPDAVLMILRNLEGMGFYAEEKHSKFLGTSTVMVPSSVGH
jgi:hypothetical protein